MNITSQLNSCYISIIPLNSPAVKGAVGKEMGRKEGILCFEGKLEKQINILEGGEPWYLGWTFLGMQ
jgi:hypothetical protein